MMTTIVADIEEDNARHLARFHDCPPEAGYIAGMIDGDGTIFIRRIRDGYQTGISLSQSRTNVLQVLRRHFGGAIRAYHSYRATCDDSWCRSEYTYIVRSYEYFKLIAYLKGHLVMKNAQMLAIEQYSLYANRPGFQDEKEALHFECIGLNANKDRHVEAGLVDRITPAYIAGLFDAEGCIFISTKVLKKYYISITQKSCPEILQKIVEITKIGRLDAEKRFKIYSRDECIQFMKLVKPYSIVKLNQILAFEQFLADSCPFTKLSLAFFCKDEKHENEEYDGPAFNDEEVAGEISAESKAICKKRRKAEPGATDKSEDAEDA